MKIIAVHYKIENEEDAIQHFVDLGFRGVTNMEINKPGVGCNQARQDAHDASLVDDVIPWFRGNYDATVGDNCYTYSFSATSGPIKSGNTGWYDGLEDRVK